MKKCFFFFLVFSWVFKTRERNVLREMLPMPDYRGGTTLVFDRMMRRIENEAFEKKRLEKQCNRNLKESESEKTVIEIRLRNKTKELNSINANRHANRVFMVLNYFYFFTFLFLAKYQFEFFIFL